MSFVILDQSSDVLWSSAMPATSVFVINMEFVGLGGEFLMR